MPSIQTLKKDIRNLEIYTGIAKSIIDAFKSKISSFADDQKLCVVAFDEMKLKPSLTYDSRRDIIEGLQDLGPNFACQSLVADHALVFYVRGLTFSWKQPLAYYITNSTVNKSVLGSLLREVLDCIINLGLHPTAIVCDQGSNNRACLTGEFNISITQPYFTYKNHTVFCFYDAPHLLKNVRNNLKDSGYQIGDHILDWEHIHQFYLKDSELAIRLAPKLKEKHFTLPGFSRMNVRLAAQVLSYSVAKGIHFMSSFGVLPSSAKYTAELCEVIDALFNVFNSRCNKSSRRYNCSFSEQVDYLKVLDDAESYITSLKPREA
jgi:hypothetical protein